MAEIDRAEAASDSLHHLPDQAALGRDRERLRRPGAYQNGIPVPDQDVPFRNAAIRPPSNPLRPAPIGERGQNGGKRRIKGGKLRHDLVPNPVPQKCGVLIRAILLPCHIVAAQPVANVKTSQVEKRANDSGLGDWPDSAQPGRPGAAEEPAEDGFGLIVARMAGGDRIAESGCDALFEKA